jgi:hypothetical protein
MRLKSEIWVQAFMRRCAAEGKYCTVVARGAAEAGAVFVIVNRLDGRFHLFGPAPGPAFDEQGDRRFVDELPFPSQESEVMALLERRRKFDSDIWIVEVEDRDGAAGIETAQL